MAVLLLLVSGALVALTYAESRRSAVERADLRLQTLAQQLSANVQQNASVLLQRAETTAADSSLVDVLSGGERPDTVQRQFQASLKEQPQVLRLELRTVADVVVVSAAAVDAPEMPASWTAVPQWASRDAVTMSPPVATGDTGVYAVAVPIRRDADTIGFFVTWRRVVSGASSRELLEHLMGPHTRILVGQPEGVWVDLLDDEVLPALALEPDDRGAYWVHQEDQQWMGAVQTIAGTPWSLRVEVPASVVFGPSWLLLKNTAAVALLLTALGTFGGWVISRRLLAPLRALTRAAIELADGHVTTKVPFSTNDEIGSLAAAFNIMAARVAKGRRELETRVQERTEELTRALAQVREHSVQLEGSNRELESFCYTISHDLRAPLRSIDGFSDVLLTDHADQLDDTGRGYLMRVRRAAKRMDALINDLLELAKVSRVSLDVRPVAIERLAERAIQDLQEREPGRVVEVVIHSGLQAHGDPRLLALVFQNLLENAWKFTAPRAVARIECGVEQADGASRYFVRDNGVGFDMAHASKLFGIFQRLHAMDEFPGTGVGLAIVQRVIERHGGRIWADAAPDAGATFFFTLEATHG